MCTSSHIHQNVTNKFQQVNDSSIATIHQAHNNTKHIVHTTFINNYDSFQLHAMRLDMTPICMWYQITSEVVTLWCNKHIIITPNYHP